MAADDKDPADKTQKFFADAPALGRTVRSLGTPGIGTAISGLGKTRTVLSEPLATAFPLRSRALQDRADAVAKERAGLVVAGGDIPDGKVEASSRLALAEATLRDAASREAQRESQDDATFWFRRFMVGLSLGNGAGFLAMASGILQAEDFTKLPATIAEPFTSFGRGLIMSGLIPLFLYFSRTPKPGIWWDAPVGAPWWQAWIRWAAAWRLVAFWTALLSALFFMLAVRQSVGLVEQITTPKPAPAAQTTAGSPPTSPSAPVATSPRPSPPPETPAPPPRKSEPQGAASPPAADRKADRG